MKECEDYKSTFALIESEGTLQFGFKAVMKCISCTKQSNLFLHFLSTLKRFSSPEASSRERGSTWFE